jgi:hypothetical protein
MAMFASGPKAPVSFFRSPSPAYIAAGQFGVTDALSHSMQVKVALVVKPGTGTVTTPFTVTWASTTAPSGFVFDVQIKRPGSSVFVFWQMAQTAKSATFTPDAGVGTYQFQALMRKVAGGTSTYSLPKKITVS